MLFRSCYHQLVYAETIGLQDTHACFAHGPFQFICTLCTLYNGPQLVKKSRSYMGLFHLRRALFGTLSIKRQCSRYCHRQDLLENGISGANSQVINLQLDTKLGHRMAICVAFSCFGCAHALLCELTALTHLCCCFMPVHRGLCLMRVIILKSNMIRQRVHPIASSIPCEIWMSASVKLF